MKKQKFTRLVILVIILVVFVKIEAKGNASEESEENEETTPEEMETYKYLVKRLKQSAAEERTTVSKQRVISRPYAIPGPFEPLPGRSHNGDYWPVFPFSNQYSGGVDLDPSISRHIGGDINIPIPSWGMMDITGRWFNRISDTTTKFGYLNHPVNMLGLNKEDFATLVSDPRLQANRYLQPTLPLGKVPKSNVPMSCKPPMCNPYTGTFQLGIEHDVGGHDGNEGDINIPFPVSKGVAYRFPIGGRYYYDIDNITITYGHNLAPLDPYSNPYFFNNDYTRRRELLAPEPDVFPREKRSIMRFTPVFAEEIREPASSSQKVTSKDFKSHRPMQNFKKWTTHNKQVSNDELAYTVDPQFRYQYESYDQDKVKRLRLTVAPNFWQHQRFQKIPEISLHRILLRRQINPLEIDPLIPYTDDTLLYYF